jgi:hypothetical protein
MEARLFRRAAAFWFVCTCAYVASAQTQQQAPSAAATADRAGVIAIVQQIQRADYEGNRETLAKLFNDLLPFTDEPEISSRVRYWRGFAKWRRAINGANETPTPSDLVQDLSDGTAEFAAALQLDPDFVDAKIGAASCMIFRMFFEGTFNNITDMARVRATMAPPMRLLKEAQNAAPENPRLLWVIGPNEWTTPPAAVGQAKAMETYQHGLQDARAQRGTVTDPLDPSWGEPELLMNLAWANLHRAEPDLAAAGQYAQAALKLVPYWHYVRDILLPQIQQAKANRQKLG